MSIAPAYPFDVAGRAQRNIKTERDGVGVSEFNLIKTRHGPRMRRLEI